MSARKQSKHVPAASHMLARAIETRIRHQFHERLLRALSHCRIGLLDAH